MRWGGGEEGVTGAGGAQPAPPSPAAPSPANKAVWGFKSHPCPTSEDTHAAAPTTYSCR